MTNDIDCETLIALVRSRPTLWDKTLYDYKCKSSTRKCWKEVCAALNENFELLSDDNKRIYGKEVTKKWTNIRDAYKRSRRNIRKASRSGAGPTHFKNYIYNDQLQFLLKVIEDRPTEDSISASEIDDSTVYPSEDNEIENSFIKPRHDNRLKNTKINKIEPFEDRLLKILEKDKVEDDSTVYPSESEDNEIENSFKKPRHDNGLKNTKINKIKPFEDRLLKILEKDKVEVENRHISFFKGIVPSLHDFDEDEVIELQMGVLKLISNIRKEKSKKATNKH